MEAHSNGSSNNKAVDDGFTKLSEDDLEKLSEKIVAKAEEALLARFYGNLGQGLWALIWKAVLLALAGLAAYGATKGTKL